MTNENLEKLSFGQLVREIVHVEIEYSAVLDEIRTADNLAELKMGNSEGRAKEYKNRLNDLYREVARRDKEHYSGHGNHDHGGESG